MAECNRPPLNPSISIEDEGIEILTAHLTKINFIGGNVTVTEVSAGEIAVTVSGASSGNPLIAIEDEGVPILTGSLVKINYVGGGITATETAAGEIEVTVPVTDTGDLIESTDSGNEVRIPRIVKMTQVDYDAITPVATTMYVII